MEFGEEEDEFLELFGLIYCWLHIVTGHLASLLERLILFLDGKAVPCYLQYYTSGRSMEEAEPAHVVIIMNQPQGRAGLIPCLSGRAQWV